VKRVVVLLFAASTACAWVIPAAFSPLGVGRSSVTPIPAGWTECEYLESTGTQYINTAYTNTGYTAFNIVYSRTASVGYGHVISSDARYCLRGNSSDAELVANYNSGTQTAVVNPQPATGAILSVYMDYDKVSVNTSDITITAHTHVPYTQSPICIFGVPVEITAMKNVKARVYSCDIIENGDVVRNLIPALDPNSVPCMFDTVTQVPFYNDGTGDFLYKIKEH
jgi:hypothetical protein